MKLLRKFVFSFRAKVTLVSVLTLLLVMSLSNYFHYRFSIDVQFEQLRQQMKVIAQTASLLVDVDSLEQIPMNRDGVMTAPYQVVANRLKQVRDLNPSIKYIYTLRPTDTPDRWQFMVDLDPELELVGKREVTAYPGDTYEAGRFPELINAVHGPSADKSLIEDEWGITLSGYAPIRNRAGQVIAVLGVDMDAKDVYLAQQTVRRLTIWLVVLGAVLSGMIGIYVSERITVRIRRLTEGMRRLAGNELTYRVKDKGHDEIRELSDGFNDMAGSLLESRKKLEEYFFRVVQSLIRMLEAKDKYTQGHSERVGVYAQQVALKMGYSQDEADMLRRAGELHDIGKLAIHQNILSKEGRLTPEEWEIIRQHPIIGKQALEPVCFSEIVLTCVHSHHERYDGLGYPQKLKGDEVSIFAHIISIVDAYDAMTTDRPYRQAMDKASALKEIKKHAGTQFHPHVAETFVCFMNEGTH